MKKASFLAYFLLLSLFLLTQKVSAQSVGSTIASQFPDQIQQQLDVTIDPQVPAPYQNVSVSIAAYGTDLNSATIHWVLNGKTVASGVGIKNYTWNVGAPGKSNNLVITVNPTDGTTFFQTISIVPENLDVLWQANSYTPPFYEGKALFAPEGTVTIMAMPGFISTGGSVIGSKKLIYTWTENDTVLGDQSGYGVNTLTLTGDVISKPLNIDVDVKSTDGTLEADQDVIINPENPEALLYADDPLYGILFNHAITDTYGLSAQEVTFQSFPFYFNGKDRTNSDLSYNWQLNNSQILSGNSSDSMTFRNTQSNAGTASISLGISSVSEILQNASASFNLDFTKPTSNFFGL